MYAPLDAISSTSLDTPFTHVSHKIKHKQGRSGTSSAPRTPLAPSQNAHPSVSTRAYGSKVSKGPRYDAVLIFSRTPGS